MDAGHVTRRAAVLSPPHHLRQMHQAFTRTQSPLDVVGMWRYINRRMDGGRDIDPAGNEQPRTLHTLQTRHTNAVCAHS